MAIITNKALTLADFAKRIDPNGKISVIVELLTQHNPILEDMVFVEANGPTSHKTTVRTGLPEATWRKFNYGVKQSKSTTAQITDGIGMLETYSKIDKSLADLNGNTAEFRLSEDRAFLQTMNDQMAKAVFYGDTTQQPELFNGLAVRYNDLSAPSAQNIVNAGGSGNHLTSVYLVVWSPNTVHGIFPKGAKAGLNHDDLGVDTLTDGDGGEYQGYRTHYKWDCGLTVRDWRYVVRIANIDTSKLDDSKAATNIAKLMVKAIKRIPNLRDGNAAFYMNRDIEEYLDLQATEKTSLAISVRETEGMVWTAFRGVPIRTCDALTSNETQVV